ncbi:MAG TPA: response regulator transcription factor [Amycolatopsis sp.]|nr:response regulator transcription factor [Amycolatopsis sp.]
MPSDVTTGTVRVFLVDDQAAVRRGIRAYLEVLGIVVAAEAGDGVETLRQLEAMDRRGDLPDVVLLDLLMPRMDGITTTGRIARHYPGVRVVILTSFGQEEGIRAALARGATGYLLKDAGPVDVVTAIQDAHRAGSPHGRGPA